MLAKPFVFQRDFACHQIKRDHIIFCEIANLFYYVHSVFSNWCGLLN